MAALPSSMTTCRTCSAVAVAGSGAGMSVVGNLRCTFESRTALSDIAANASPNNIVPGPVTRLQWGLGDDNINVGVKEGYYYF